MVPISSLYARQSFSIPHVSRTTRFFSNYTKVTNSHKPPGFAPLPPPRLFDESRAPEIVAGNAFLQLLGTTFFFARAYSRLVLIKSWKPEDTILLFAWVCRCEIAYLHYGYTNTQKLFATGCSICQYGEVAHGAGHHLGVVLHNNPNDAVESQKWAYASNLLLFPAFSLPKLSICYAYSRIFGESLINRRMIQGLILLISIPSIPFFFMSVFQCKPINVFWTEGRPPDKCTLLDFKVFYIHGAINVFSDLALMAIVFPRVLELRISPRQKWALFGIVGLGSLAAVAGIVRMSRLSITLSKPNFDASWDAYDLSIWTSTEIYVSLVCAAAPGVKPVVSILLPKILGTSLASRTRTTSEGHEQTAPIELYKSRRATIGSARTRRNTHDTILDEGDGPYVEVARGVDRHSLESVHEDPERQHARKNSDILIIQTNAR